MEYPNPSVRIVSFEGAGVFRAHRNLNTEDCRTGTKQWTGSSEVAPKGHEPLHKGLECGVAFQHPPSPAALKIPTFLKFSYISLKMTFVPGCTFRPPDLVE